MAQRNIPGIGPCEITRLHCGSFAVTLPNGDTAEVVERENSRCAAKVTAGTTQGWEVALAFTNHLRALRGVVAPEPVRMSDAECEGYAAEQDSMNRRLLGRMGFRATVAA